jgi:hypothetical protein
MNKPKYNIGDVIINSDNNLADNIIIVIMQNTDVDKNNGEDTFYYGTATTDPDKYKINFWYTGENKTRDKYVLVEASCSEITLVHWHNESTIKVERSELSQAEHKIRQEINYGHG